MRHWLLFVSLSFCILSFGLNNFGFGAKNILSAKSTHHVKHLSIKIKKKVKHISTRKKINYCFFLSNHVNKKINFELVNNFTHEKEIVRLSAEDVFSKIKSELYNKDISMIVAQKSLASI